MCGGETAVYCVFEFERVEGWQVQKRPVSCLFLVLACCGVAKADPPNPACGQVLEVHFRYLATYALACDS